MKTNKNADIQGNSQNRIAQGTVINGDITSEAGFRIDGKIIGTLNHSCKSGYRKRWSY